MSAGEQAQKLLEPLAIAQDGGTTPAQRSLEDQAKSRSKCGTIQVTNGSLECQQRIPDSDRIRHLCSARLFDYDSQIKRARMAAKARL